MVNIKEDRCQGCGLCVQTCPKKILYLDKSKVNKRGFFAAKILDGTKCTSCTLCAVMCPDVAIEVYT